MQRYGSYKPTGSGAHYARLRQSTYRRLRVAGRKRLYGAGSVVTGGGYRRVAARRMQGAPAALYAPVSTNATSVKSVDGTAGTLGLPIIGSSSPTCLIIPKIGAAFFNRLGNRTRALSLQIVGIVNPSLGNAAAVPEQLGRIIVYYDRQSNDANPAASDIITSYSNAGAAATTAYDFLNMNNRDRFVVLRDRKMYLPPLGINGATPAAQQGVFVDPNIANHSFMYNEFIKLQHMESLYNTVNGGTVGDITSGAFGILAFSSTDTNATPAWQFTFNVRMKFLD